MANHSQQQIETSSNSTRTCSSECIAWLTVFGIEAVAIVTLNALTIIVYLKERSLRKRSMYLVINQAFADMFTGASIFISLIIWAYDFELWTINPPLSDELTFHIWVLASVSPSASLIIITLERFLWSKRTQRFVRSSIVSSKRKSSEPLLLLFGLQLGQVQLAQSQKLPLKDLYFSNEAASFLSYAIHLACSAF